MESKVVKIHLEDGRQAEKHVVEAPDGVKTTELYAEEPKQLKLEKRVIEKSKPVVFERKVEKFDPITGQMIESLIESTEPNTPMQLREHLGLASPATSTPYATKEDLKDAIEIAVRNAIQSLQVENPEPYTEMETEVLPKASDVIKKRMDETEQEEAKWYEKIFDPFALIVIAVQLGVLYYVLM